MITRRTPFDDLRECLSVEEPSAYPDQLNDGLRLRETT